MKGMNELVRQAQVMQKKMAKLQEDLQERTVEGTAGGGMVVAVVSGSNELKSLTIDKTAVDPNDVEMLQDLVLSAVNDGIKKAKAMMEAENYFAGRGFTLPTGMLAARLTEIANQAQRNNLQASKDIAISQAETRAAASARSAAGSVMRMPPATFRKTSSPVKGMPQRASSTARMVDSRPESSPTTVRRGVPRGLGATSA